MFSSSNEKKSKDEGNDTDEKLKEKLQKNLEQLSCITGKSVISECSECIFGKCDCRIMNKLRSMRESCKNCKCVYCTCIICTCVLCVCKHCDC